MILHPIDTTLLSCCGIPEKMNNPFDYEPHPLCIQICKELQEYLFTKEEWREEIDKGKMFGVLIVKDELHTYYLAAYSGQIGGRSDWNDFVPAVFDYLQPDGYFKIHETEITRINHAILQVESDERMKKAQEQITLLQKARQETIANFQLKMKEAKTKRDSRRQKIREMLQEVSKSNTELSQTEAIQAAKWKSEEQAMIKESQFIKAELRRLKKSLAKKTYLEKEFEDYQENIKQLKQLRKTLSDALQQWLFSQFRMQNPQGETKDLQEIFRDYACQGNSNAMALKSIPPAGSGECCEPKLLQYAYNHHLKPLQMAMFWWGESPKEEIRHHLQFYPACNGKCKPILHWMLPEDTYTTKEPFAIAEIDILYEDRELAVICKPAGMLSVPGKDKDKPSVYTLMRKKYPEATGPLIVHRLDMATSGLMIIAKTEFAYHKLQEQFINHHIQKKYTAIICCRQAPKSSYLSGRHIISLPLMPDYLDRPRQIVNHEQGKEAITEFEILGEEEKVEKKTSKEHYLKIALYPKTGRTHQLRVHCAHKEGLNAPILGDPLYGNEKAMRLYLHAESILFTHPMTGKKLYIERKADF